MRRLLILVLAIGLAAPAASQQVNSKDVLSGFALRDNFRDRRTINRNLFGLRQFEEEQPPLSFQLTSGVAYSDAGAGVRVTSLPQEFEIDFNRTDTTVLFDIDAYDWVRTPGDNASGVGDPSVEVVQRLWCSTSNCGAHSNAISISGGFTVPSGSDVSGGTAGQMLKVAYGHLFSDDSQHTFVFDRIKLSLRFDHINRVDDGTSNYVATGKFYYQHNFTKALDVFGNIAYSHQSGAGNVTTAGVGVDFPISNQSFGLFSGVSGTLSGTCALSASHHCGRIELDFVLPFN